MQRPWVRRVQHAKTQGSHDEGVENRLERKQKCVYSAFGGIEGIEGAELEEEETEPVSIC
jgi:hypothetical protein